MRPRVILAVLLVVLSVNGCGKETNRVTATNTSTSVGRSKPGSSHRRQLVVPRKGATPATIYYIDDDGTVYPGGGGGGHPHFNWSGGPATIPFGDGVTRESMIAAALSLASVNRGIITMNGAGFIRRSDLDFACYGDSGCAVTIAFQKPGVSPAVQQPFLLVRSRNVGTAVITQVAGMEVTQAPDSVRSLSSEFTPFVVVAAGSSFSADSTFNAVSLGDFLYAGWDALTGNYPGFSADMLEIWTTIANPCIGQAYEDFAFHVLNYEFFGALTGIPGGEAQIALNAGAAGAAVGVDWMWTHRYGYPCS